MGNGSPSDRSPCSNPPAVPDLGPPLQPRGRQRGPTAGNPNQPSGLEDLGENPRSRNSFAQQLPPAQGNNLDLDVLNQRLNEFQNGSQQPPTNAQQRLQDLRQENERLRASFYTYRNNRIMPGSYKSRMALSPQVLVSKRVIKSRMALSPQFLVSTREWLKK